MAALNHVHTYVFMETRNGTRYWKCDDPHCTHFNRESLIKGKASICTQCRVKEVIMDWKDINGKQLKRKRPLCMDCAQTKDAIAFRRNRDIVENLLGKL